MAIKRRQLFEFNDQIWLLRFMTAWMTRMLHACHQGMANGRIWAPKVAQFLAMSGGRRIVDLCSGGGGLLNLAALQPSSDLPDGIVERSVGGAGDRK